MEDLASRGMIWDYHHVTRFSTHLAGEMPIAGAGPAEAPNHTIVIPP